MGLAILYLLVMILPAGGDLGRFLGTSSCFCFYTFLSVEGLVSFLPGKPPSVLSVSLPAWPPSEDLLLRHISPLQLPYIKWIFLVSVKKGMSLHFTIVQLLI